MMNKEIKDKWVAALRSGKYKQGIGWLRTTDEHFCCLGVLCEIQGAEWVMGPSGKLGVVGGNGMNIETGMPPSKYAQGLVELFVDGVNDDIAHELASRNDAGDNFDTIATFIEEVVPIDVS